MNTASCVSFYTQSWKDLYQAAIHESDQLPERIADAETALVMRTRELFYASVERVEKAKVWMTRCASFTHCVAH